MFSRTGSVSIPYSTIKILSNVFVTTFSVVSIPYSTIKISRELKEVKDKPVSIPYSTIKINQYAVEIYAQILFQFLIVRLKFGRA